MQKVTQEFEIKMKITVEYDVPSGQPTNIYTHLSTFIDDEDKDVHIFTAEGTIVKADILKFKRITGEEKNYE